jgi:hypothetical protein
VISAEHRLKLPLPGLDEIPQLTDPHYTATSLIGVAKKRTRQFGDLPPVTPSQLAQEFSPAAPFLGDKSTRLHPSLFLPRSRPRLSAKAAEGGLEPALASRLRGADPNQSNSCAPPQPFGCLLCSWHTIVANRTSGRSDRRTEFLRPKTLPHFCRVKTRVEQR